MSVIVPCFNAAKYVRQALISLCSQTHKNIEGILIDDGSTDNSADILREFARLYGRLRVLDVPHRGAAVARNVGLAEARGQYVAFLDADDYWAITKIGKHVRYLEANRKIGVSFSAVQFVNEAGGYLHRRHPKVDGLTDYDLYCRNPLTNGSNAVFRSEVFKTMRFDEELVGFQDVDCWLRIAFAGPDVWRFEGLNEVLTYCRVRRGSISSNFEDHYTSACRAWRKSFMYAPRVAKQYARLAEAFQLRFYARKAIAVEDCTAARAYFIKALRKDPRILLFEPLKTLATAVCFAPWCVPVSLRVHD